MVKISEYTTPRITICRGCGKEIFKQNKMYSLHLEGITFGSPVVNICPTCRKKLR